MSSNVYAIVCPFVYAYYTYSKQFTKRDNKRSRDYSLTEMNNIFVYLAPDNGTRTFLWLSHLNEGMFF